MGEVMKQVLGHVTAAGGSQVTACLESGITGGFGSIGDMVKVRCAEHDAVGIVSATRVEPGSPPRDVLVIELFGELVRFSDGRAQFSRGVSRYPASGAPVVSVRDADLSAIFNPTSGANLRIG